jgi:hypothetical protein
MLNASHHGWITSRALLAGLFISSTFAIPQQQAATCSGATLTAKYPSPSMAPGFAARLIGTGFHVPRSLVFDSSGHLIVLEQSIGITVVTLDDNGGDCVSITSKKTIVNNYTVSPSVRAKETMANVCSSIMG